jgi:hypothetical protein
MHNTWTRRAVILASLLAAAPAAAQRVNPDRVVDLHINLEAQNQSFEGSVREGSRFNLSIDGQGDFALVPVVTSAERQQITLSVLRVNGERVRTVETVTATVGQPAVLRSLGRTTVVVERLRMAPRRQAAAGVATFARNDASARRFAGAFAGECCVRCGSVRACGCAVSMDCGSCCSDSCCGIITQGGPASGAPEGRTFAQMVTSPCNRPIPVWERRFTPAPAVTRLASSR